MANRAFDWESIEKDYRAGILSIREVAKLNGISEGAIRKNAKAQGWARDLSIKIAEKVRTDLVRSGTHQGPESEREIIDFAAATVVQVVRSHRKRIGQGHDLTELLTNQLIDVVGQRDAFETIISGMCEGDQTGERESKLMRAVSIGTHAAIALNLANATKVWVGLERQAFSIEDGSASGGDDDRTYTDAELAVKMAYILSKAGNGAG